MEGVRMLDDEVLEVLRRLKRERGPRKRLGYMRKLRVVRDGLQGQG